jgi:hypothetical protein
VQLRTPKQQIRDVAEQLCKGEEPPATATRVLSEKINEKAAPGNRVTGKQLQDRVRYKEGKDKIGNSEYKSETSRPLAIPIVNAVIPKRTNPTKVIVNESGLYCLIIRSDKPRLSLFRRWVTGEVLPSICTTDSISIDMIYNGAANGKG